MASKTSAGHQPRCADHDPPGELVLCRRLDPDKAADTLKRYDFVAVQNGGGLGRDVTMVGLIEESCYPEMFAPFRLEEGGQFIVRQQSTGPYMVVQECGFGYALRGLHQAAGHHTVPGG